MRIITTFDDRLFVASGKRLLESVARHLPGAEMLVYEELKSERTDVPSVRVDQLPEFVEVMSRHRDVIPREMGGTAERLEGYNRRWFGWFRKIVSQYDAITRNTYDGYTVFLDTDVRAIAPFADEVIRAQLPKAVGVFTGLRDSGESGGSFYDGRAPLARPFVERFMNLFLSGQFRALPRWDDSFTMAHCMAQMPDAVHDFAAGIAPLEHTNSNGHTTGGQVLPATVWDRYLEHDKGIHWRGGVVPQVHPVRSATRRGLLGKWLGGLWRKAS